MTLDLKPELEALIRKRLATGEFSSPEEVVQYALESLGADEDWLADNRESIAARIQEGWDEAQRGELTGGDTVRSEMQRFKDDWMKQRKRPQGLAHNIAGGTVVPGRHFALDDLF
jgi:Arc/MetJ-type ribon-helix-helix transcriptional regulator